MEGHGEEHTKCFGKFLQMSKLEEICIEKHAIVGGQVTPRFIEFGLAPTCAHLLCNVAIDSKDRFSDGAPVVTHTLDDLGAA